jgi:GNAT superfamily N-acetyltransferase
MNPITIETLPRASRQRLNRFYRDQRSPMRAAQGATLWVAREHDIIAGLSLTPVAEGAWLTGLLVAEACRRQQVARRLLQAALATVEGPVWLFCHPDLQGFYEKVGFRVDPLLPPALAERLQRYRLSKFLLAMEHPGMAESLSRPGWHPGRETEPR